MFLLIFKRMLDSVVQLTAISCCKLVGFFIPFPHRSRRPCWLLFIYFIISTLLKIFSATSIYVEICMCAHIYKQMCMHVWDRYGGWWRKIWNKGGFSNFISKYKFYPLEKYHSREKLRRETTTGFNPLPLSFILACVMDNIKLIICDTVMKGNRK